MTVIHTKKYPTCLSASSKSVKALLPASLLKTAFAITTGLLMTLPTHAKLTITPISALQNSSQQVAHSKVLPESFEQRITTEFKSYPVSNILKVLSLVSEYDISVAREIDTLMMDNINYKEQSISHIFSEIMQKNNLTYTFIGDDMIFVYPDNAYSACLYNTGVGESSGNANFNTNIDKTLSIDTSDTALTQVLKWVGTHTDYRILIDNKLILPSLSANRRLNQVSETIRINNKNMNQILTVLAYRNDFTYRYLDNKTILITANPNNERCRSI